MPDTLLPDAPPADQPGGDGGRSGRKRVAPFIAVVVALVVGGLAWVLAGADPVTNEDADSPLIGRPAPEIVSTTIDEQPFDLARRRGSWVVLNFFWSGCIPCKTEHPELVKFAEQQAALGTDGVELYTIATQPDNDEQVRAFFQEYGGGDWPIVRDYDGEAYVDFGVTAVPETWIIDSSGIVRQRLITRITADGLTALIAQLQAEST